MRGETDWWLLLPRPVRRLPADLAAVLLGTLLTVLVVLVPGVRETPLRVVLGLPFVLFLPGYAFIALLFPERGPDRVRADERTGPLEERSTESRVKDGGIDGIERVALSFGLSIAVVPLIGLVLNFTPWGIRLVPVLLSVSAFTVGATVGAALRRWELPEEERFSVPYREWFEAGRVELFEPESRADTILNVLLVVSVLLAAGSVTYAVAVPKQGESFTEFYILTENETGALVADDYPTEFERGESKPVVVGIGNHEHEPVSYEVVVALQRVRFENNSTTVLEERELGRFGQQLAANMTWHTTYEVRPTMTGTRLRLVFLLYRGGAPAEPTVEGAYRELHLWVNVSETSSARVVPPESKDVSG